MKGKPPAKDVHLGRPQEPPPQVVTTQQAQFFSGPLPPPATLEQYERIHPGLANRIVVMAEQQAAHRRDLEHRIVAKDIWIAKGGQLVATTVVVLAMLLGTYLIMHDKPTTGLFAMFGPLGGVAGLFLYGKRKQRPAQ